MLLQRHLQYHFGARFKPGDKHSGGRKRPPPLAAKQRERTLSHPSATLHGLQHLPDGGHDHLRLFALNEMAAGLHQDVRCIR